MIYVPEDDHHTTWMAACMEHCERYGYEVAAVILTGPNGYADAMAMILGQEAEVVVAGRRDHLPPDRIPRVDVVTELAAPMVVTTPVYCRPRLLR